MATITEDYVSFEIAKLLKEKGFDARCPMIYTADGELLYTDVKHHNMYAVTNKQLKYCTDIIAPSQAMAMKWLREVHGLYISLEPCYDYDSMHVVFLAFVQNVVDVHEFMDGRKNVVSHPNAEKSCELSIKYCLENLI